jgi:hypothetical protein
MWTSMDVTVRPAVLVQRAIPDVTMRISEVTNMVGPVQTPDSASSHPFSSHPDVWWGPDGIDALCWADGIPYEFEGGGE